MALKSTPMQQQRAPVQISLGVRRQSVAQAVVRYYGGRRLIKRLPPTESPVTFSKGEAEHGGIVNGASHTLGLRALHKAWAPLQASTASLSPRRPYAFAVSEASGSPDTYMPETCGYNTVASTCDSITVKVE